MSHGITTTSEDDGNVVKWDLWLGRAAFRLVLSPSPASSTDPTLRFPTIRVPLNRDMGGAVQLWVDAKSSYAVWAELVLLMVDEGE